MIQPKRDSRGRFLTGDKLLTDAMRTEIKVQAELRFDEYRRLALGATKQGLKKVANNIAKTARRIAPRGKPHRIRRRYAKGGEVYEDLKPLRQSIITKVKERKSANSVMALVKVKKAGYSVFVEHGTKKMAARSFLRAARDMEIGKSIEILRQEWPS